MRRPFPLFSASEPSGLKMRRPKSRAAASGRASGRLQTRAAWAWPVGSSADVLAYYG